MPTKLTKKTIALTPEGKTDPGEKKSQRPSF